MCFAWIVRSSLLKWRNDRPVQIVRALPKMGHKSERKEKRKESRNMEEHYKAIAKEMIAAVQEIISQEDMNPYQLSDAGNMLKEASNYLSKVRYGNSLASRFAEWKNVDKD